MQDDQQDSPQLPAIDQGHANDESLIRTHARIRRTPVAASPVTFFTSLALIVVFVFAWFYVRRYVGDMDSQGVLSSREELAAMQAYINRPKEDPGPVVVDGAALYAQQCVACHQATGQGLAGAFPPLVGSEWVTGDPNLPIKVLLSGLSGEIVVKGNTYNGAMPAFGSVWNDAEIAAVVNYIRTSWGNEASEVAPEEVAAIRADTGSRSPWTAAELSEYFE